MWKIAPDIMVKHIFMAFFLFGVNTILCGSILSSSEMINEAEAEILTLQNGMKVCLKKTSFDENEVTIRLIAMGGFAELPPSKRASGELAAQVAIRSGIGNYSYDQIQALFYTHSLEFEGTIQPFYRVIEGVAESEEFDLLLNLIQLYFIQPRFDQEAFKQVITKSKESLKTRTHDPMHTYEENYVAFNTQHFHALRSMNAADLEHASFEDAYLFFKTCFSNPAEFICVIAGDFDPEVVKKGVESTLGAIPTTGQEGLTASSRLPTFSDGVKSKVMKRLGRADAITRLTFPIKVKINETQFEQVELTAGLIKERLIWELRKRLKPLPEFNVVVELPYYPCTETAWLIIQYISEPKQVVAAGQMILTELSKMQKEGVETREVEFLKNALLRSDTLAKKDNHYWLTTLSNYLLWGWDFKKIQKDYNSNLECEQLKKGLKAHFSLDHYSIVSAQP